MMKNILAVINDFIHDFASAMWVAALIALYLINRVNKPIGTEEFFFKFKKEFFYLGLIALAVTLLTGAGRMYTYSASPLGKDYEKTRKKLLITKHIIGFIIYGAGTYWQYRMVYG